MYWRIYADHCLREGDFDRVASIFRRALPVCRQVDLFVLYVQFVKTRPLEGSEEMDEEVKRQAPIMDAIDDKLDSSAEELRTANGKLKRVITDMRSTRHFCIDVILIFIILGIGLYLFNTLG